MKTNLTWLLLFGCIGFAFAQDDTESINGLKAKLKDTENESSLITLYNDLAWEYSFTNYDSAIKYAQLAISKSESSGAKNDLATSKEMMAMLYEISGDSEQALQLYLEGISIRKEFLNGEGLENTYNNLAILFKSLKNYQKAFDYFRLSYEIEKSINNDNGIAASLINMAIALKDLNRPDSSLILMKQAEEIARRINDSYLIINSSLNLADHLLETNHLDSAQYYYLQIVNTAAEKKDKDGLATAYIGLADIYYQRKDFKKSLEYLEKAENLARNINSMEYLKRIYALKSNAYKALNNLASAFDYQKKYIAINDSLLNIETVTMVNELEEKYKSAEKEKQITKLELQNRTTALELQQSKNQRNLFIFSTLLILAISGFIGYLFYQKRKVNQLLEEKNKVIEQALKDKDLLLKEIHHRVKNNLQIISSLLNIQSRHIQDEKASEAIKAGKNRVKSMAMIHQKLYQKDNLTGIEIDNYIQNLADSLFESYGIKSNEVRLNLSVEPLRLDVDTTIPLGLILNELISNSLKHAFDSSTESTVNVELKKMDNELLLTVSDNGCGISQPASDQSFGLKLVRSLAQKINANITVESNSGTSYIINIAKFKLV